MTLLPCVFRFPELPLPPREYPRTDFLMESSPPPSPSSPLPPRFPRSLLNSDRFRAYGPVETTLSSKPDDEDEDEDESEDKKHKRRSVSRGRHKASSLPFSAPPGDADDDEGGLVLVSREDGGDDEDDEDDEDRDEEEEEDAGDSRRLVPGAPRLGSSRRSFADSKSDRDRRLSDRDSSAPLKRPSVSFASGEVHANLILAQGTWTLWGFYSGVFFSQFGLNSLQVVQGLLLLEVMNDASTVSYLLMLFALFNALGSYISGIIYPYMQPRFQLALSSAIRVLLQLVPAFLYYSFPGDYAWLIVFSYSIEGLFTGWSDVARQTFPRSVSGKKRSVLDQINSSFQAAFDFGTTIGPVVTGVIMVKIQGLVVPTLVAPISFLVSLICFIFVPRIQTDAAVIASSESLYSINEAEIAARLASSEAGLSSFSDERQLSSSSKLRKNSSRSVSGRSRCRTCTVVCSSPPILIGFLGFLMMQTYRLKGIYPAIFASEVLHSNTDTAWIVAAFGVGGIAGSYIFKWAVKAKVPEDTKSSSLPNPASESHIAKSNSVKDKPSGSFVLWAGILLIVFAWVWLPARLMSMLPSWSILLFIMLTVIAHLIFNAGARLSSEDSGPVTGLRQTFVKFVAAGFRGILGLCFTIANQNSFLAFVMFSGFLSVLGIAQIVFSVYVWRTEREHGSSGDENDSDTELGTVTKDIHPLSHPSMNNFEKLN